MSGGCLENSLSTSQKLLTVPLLCFQVLTAFSGALAASAAMRSPIPIEPVHSFSYGHLCQREIAHRSLITATKPNYDARWRKMAPMHTCQLMYGLHIFNLILEIHFMFNGQLLNQGIR